MRESPDTEMDDQMLKQAVMDSADTISKLPPDPPPARTVEEKLAWAERQMSEHRALSREASWHMGPEVFVDSVNGIAFRPEANAEVLRLYIVAKLSRLNRMDKAMRHLVRIMGSTMPDGADPEEPYHVAAAVGAALSRLRLDHMGTKQALARANDQLDTMALKLQEAEEKLAAYEKGDMTATEPAVCS